MKIAGFICTIIFISFTLAMVISKQQHDIESEVRYARQAEPAIHHETESERLIRWSLESEEAARIYLTNSVIGFRRVLWVAPDTSSPQITNWTATAQVEFYNRMGGVVTRLEHIRFVARRSVLIACEDFVFMQAEGNRNFYRAMGITNEARLQKLVSDALDANESNDPAPR